MIRLFFSFLSIGCRFGWEVLLQLWYIQTKLKPFCHQFLKKSDGSFVEADLKRMQYYAKYVPAVSGAAYALLVKRTLTASERENMLWLSACSPVFDDYFDLPNLSEQDLFQMIQSPESFVGRTTKEQLLVAILTDLKAKIPNFPNFMQVCWQVFEAQIQAKRQENGNLSAEEIQKITFDKGGFSTLLFHALMESPPIAGDRAAIYHFGGLVQWVDDIFDLYEDTQQSLQTLATMETNWFETEKKFTDSVQVLVQKFLNLPLPLPQKKRFLHLQWFFLSRTFVAIHQFQNLQLNSQKGFSSTYFQRKELICDMEKWTNIKLWWKYYRTLNF